MNPIDTFTDWYEAERQTNLRHPSACCLSTISTDGFPNRRFLALKDVQSGQFIITGSVASRKGREIALDNRVALTFWWPFTEKQVRIQGLATASPRVEAERYFYECSRSAQVLSGISQQGQPCPNYQALTDAYRRAEIHSGGSAVACPVDWGGFRIDPVRMEFLSFQPTRFHERTCYYRLNGTGWASTRLQP